MNQRHFEKLREGVEKWNDWRTSPDGVKPDLSRYPLPAIDFLGWDFSETDLTQTQIQGRKFVNCNFSSAKLIQGSFQSCSFENCDFSSADLSSINGHEASFEDCTFEEADLKNARLHSSKIEGGTASKANFESAICEGSHWSHLDLTAASGGGARLSNCRFQGCTFKLAKFDRAQFINSKIVDCDFSWANLEVAQFNSEAVQGQFREAKLKGAVFANAVLNGSSFVGANLGGAHFTGSRCSGISFVGADLSNARFITTELSGANLRGCTMGRTTKFEQTNVKGCKVDRFSLECLHEYGLLTVGDRMGMEIHDPIAELSASYSGFTQWIHMAALTLFIAPYVWFLFARWAEMQAVLPEIFPSIPLWEALARYVINGGAQWRSGWFPNYLQLAFVVLTGIYNILRFMLLWKTKKLELQQQITGLPVQFSLSSGFWAHAFKWAQVGFWFNLCVVAFHTFHFFNLPVPVAK